MATNPDSCCTVGQLRLSLMSWPDDAPVYLEGDKDLVGQCVLQPVKSTILYSKAPNHGLEKYVVISREVL